MFTIAALLIASLLYATPTRATAQPPHEPNDSLLSAVGPLALGATYDAGLETRRDRDFFFFYTSAPAGSPVELQVTNLGGGEPSSSLAVAVLDSLGTAVAGVNYVVPGEIRALSVRLAPQKHYVEVAPNEGFGDSYRLTAAGGTGAFAPYAGIVARCAAAARGEAGAQRRLSRAEASMQRAIARIRRARYAFPATRRKARIAYRRAKARLRSKRRAARKATARREPWCSIPQ